MMGPGVDRQQPTLEDLAHSRFGKLSEAELKLLRAVRDSVVAAHHGDPGARPDDPANDPRQSDAWGSDREIRAAVIRWLCVDQDAHRQIDPQGVVVRFARISGELDLSFVPMGFPLGFLGCRLADPLLLMYADLPALVLSGSQAGTIIAVGL